jgi:hypothetical protein
MVWHFENNLICILCTLTLIPEDTHWMWIRYPSKQNGWIRCDEGSRRRPPAVILTTAKLIKICKIMRCRIHERLRCSPIAGGIQLGFLNKDHIFRKTSRDGWYSVPNPAHRFFAGNTEDSSILPNMLESRASILSCGGSSSRPYHTPCWICTRSRLRKQPTTIQSASHGFQTTKCRRISMNECVKELQRGRRNAVHLAEYRTESQD